MKFSVSVESIECLVGASHRSTSASACSALQPKPIYVSPVDKKVYEAATDTATKTSLQN